MYQHASVNEALPSGSDPINDLFAQHYAASVRIAYRVLRSREDAEDAVQTAYCAAFRHLHTFRGESSFKTWITRIVVNCCLMHLRERRNRPKLALDDVLPIFKSQVASPEALCYRAELQAAHRDAASKLPRVFHDVYTQSILRGNALPKVADQLGLTAAAAKSRLFRARRKVRHTLHPILQGRTT